MRPVRPLLWTGLLALTLALTSTRVHAQSITLLQDKVARLRAKAGQTKGVFNLDSNSFEHVMAQPRNYSVVVLFTAISSEYQCVPCKNFDPEYRLVGAGWKRIPDKSAIFFAILDFKIGESVFQKLGMTTAPSVLYFPSTGSASSTGYEHDTYDFAKNGFQAEPFAAWVSARSGVPLSVIRPFDFIAFSLKIFGLLGFIGIVHLLYSRAGKVIRSKYLWASLSMFTIFVMISGHMWNQIRHPPYTLPSRDGRPGFIAQGFQNQFGLETQIVAVIYAVLCGGVISLISSVPRIDSPSKQRIAVWIWLAIVSIMFSLLMQFFRLKHAHYPFRLLF